MIHNGSDYDEELASLNRELTFPMGIEDICNYSGSQTTAEFVRYCAIPNPYKFDRLDDQDLQFVIVEILSDIHDEDKFIYYATLISRFVGLNHFDVQGYIRSYRDLAPAEILGKLRHHSTRKVIHL